MIEPEPVAMPHSAVERSLESLLRHTDSAHVVVYLPYLRLDAIVVGRRGNQVELLFDGGGVATLFDTTVAEPIDDASRHTPLLRQALQHLGKQALSTRTRLAAELRWYANALATIRERLIRQHDVGRIDREQVNALLRALDLPVMRERSSGAFGVPGTLPGGQR